MTARETLTRTQDFWWSLAMLEAAALWFVVIVFPFPMSGWYWWGLMELDGVVHFSSGIALVLLLGRKRYGYAILLLFLWEAIEAVLGGYSPFESFWMVMDTASDIIIGGFGVLVAVYFEGAGK